MVGLHGGRRVSASAYLEMEAVSGKAMYVLRKESPNLKHGRTVHPL